MYGVVMDPNLAALCSADCEHLALLSVRSHVTIRRGMHAVLHSRLIPSHSTIYSSARLSVFHFLSKRTPRACQMSVGDILIANRLHKLTSGHFVGVPTTIVDDYPNLIALHDGIVGEPRIAAFIAKHAN